MSAAEMVCRILRPANAVASRVGDIQVFGQSAVGADRVAQKISGVLFQCAHGGNSSGESIGSDALVTPLRLGDVR